MTVARVPVLIVGAGVAGLTAALLLHQQGVESLLVERHAGTSPQPKARRFNPRSTEVFRALGLADQVERAATTLANFTGMLVGPTLAEARPPEVSEPVRATINRHALIGRYTPAPSVLCPQDVLEPVLRDAALARGGDLRFGTELVSLSQDGTGVSATVVDRASGAHRTVLADYVIAADGARSPIREALGIPRSGRGRLASNLDVYFRADLADLVRGREFNLCQIDNPAASGAFVSINGTDRWLFSTSSFPVDGGLAQDLEPQRWVELLRALIGVPDLPVEIISSMPWESGMYVADRFAQGRIFLVGDAAHVMPPLAAAGANTAIQDAHNLAWKVAAVLTGTAGPALLDSYHQERHPVAWATAEYSSQVSGHLGTMINAVVQGTTGQVDVGASMFGAQYTAGAFVPDGRGPAPVDRYAPEGRPGTRVPHAWVRGAGSRLSTLDLVGPGFTLLTGGDGAAWCAAGAEVARRTGVRLSVHQIGNDARTDDGVLTTDPDADWLALAGIKPDGALLIRPDHIVAWHSADSVADPVAALDQALTRVLGR